MADVFLAFGSNLGHRSANILRALMLLQQSGLKLIASSSLIETEPWGFSSSRKFINAVAHFATSLSPTDLLQVTQRIEISLGRTEKTTLRHYHDRPMDIDILFYDHLILHLPQLVIPHPLISERLFVLRPLCEIAPALMHPQSGKTMRQLLAQCEEHLAQSEGNSGQQPQQE